MNKIKSCPFCGHNTAPVIVWASEDAPLGSNDTDQVYVVCNIHEGGCGATGGYKDTEKQAIQNWNRRPAIYV